MLKIENLQGISQEEYERMYQEDTNKFIGERLSKNTESVTKKVTEEVEARYKDYVSKETYESLNSEFEKAKKLNDEHDSIVQGLNTKIGQLETNSLKVRIALESGLPYEMASRLNGTDEESIRRDASTLSGFVSAKKVPPKRNQEARDTKENAYKELLKDLRKE